MGEKRMACWQCPRYDRETRRCRDGKANPRRKADTVAVAELLGLRALCHYNPYRDGLARRWHFPHQPFLPAPAGPGLRFQKIEVEILEEEEGQDA
ncbi:MAG TPA: hypothetical protein VKT32_11320 [Chthonomonadaceae bacterium]|nr:hypothetical protein [Chthonomonadaceae bacterium]